MSCTIEYALQNFKMLKQAQVVAGQRGLERAFTWAHIVDLPDVEPWLREGDLFLTTAFALKDNPDAQDELIPMLARKGVAGILIAMGYYFHAIPEGMKSG
jgi:purine catabolism regulator